MKSVAIRHLALITLAIAGSASANSYITLDAGDTAAYATATGQRVNVSVTGSTSTSPSTGWHKYSTFIGTGERLVNTKAASQSVYVFNQERGVSEKFISFVDPVGSKYNFTMGCAGGGVIAAKGLTMRTAAGSFKNVVHMSIINRCADIGTTDVWFAPKVGLIKWTTTGKIGPRSFELTNGSIGGKVFGAAATQSALKVATSFSNNAIALNGNTTEVGATMDLTNTTAQDMVIHFGSGQEFELSLLDGKSNVINSWGAHVRFIQGAHDVTIAAGQTVSFGGTVSLSNLNGAPLTPGKYAVRIEVLGSATSLTGAAVPTVIRAESPLILSGK